MLVPYYHPTQLSMLIDHVSVKDVPFGLGLLLWVRFGLSYRFSEKLPSEKLFFLRGGAIGALSFNGSGGRSRLE